MKLRSILPLCITYIEDGGQAHLAQKEVLLGRKVQKQAPGGWPIGDRSTILASRLRKQLGDSHMIPGCSQSSPAIVRLSCMI